MDTQNQHNLQDAFARAEKKLIARNVRLFSHIQSYYAAKQQAFEDASGSTGKAGTYQELRSMAKLMSGTILDEYKESDESNKTATGVYTRFLRATHELNKKGRDASSEEVFHQDLVQILNDHGTSVLDNNNKKEVLAKIYELSNPMALAARQAQVANKVAKESIKDGSKIPKLEQIVRGINGDEAAMKFGSKEDTTNKPGVAGLAFETIVLGLFNKIQQDVKGMTKTNYSGTVNKKTDVSDIITTFKFPNKTIEGGFDLKFTSVNDMFYSSPNRMIPLANLAKDNVLGKDNLADIMYLVMNSHIHKHMAEESFEQNLELLQNLLSVPTLLMGLMPPGFQYGGTTTQAMDSINQDNRFFIVVDGNIVLMTDVLKYVKKSIGAGLGSLSTSGKDSNGNAFGLKSASQTIDWGVWNRETKMRDNGLLQKKKQVLSVERKVNSKVSDDELYGALSSMEEGIFRGSLYNKILKLKYRQSVRVQIIKAGTGVSATKSSPFGK
jgi:hypothetical protein